MNQMMMGAPMSGPPMGGPGIPPVGGSLVPAKLPPVPLPALPSSSAAIAGTDDGQEEPYDTNAFIQDGPGEYVISAKAIVCEKMSLESDRVCNLDKGSKVNVIEIH